MNKNAFISMVLMPFFALGLSFSSRAETLSVERNDIIGTWEDRDGEFAKGWMTYKHDGTWDSELVVIFSDESVARVLLEGNWSLDGNRLLYETTWSSDERFPLYSGFDVIVTVTQNRFDFKPNGRNEIESSYRVE